MNLTKHQKEIIEKIISEEVCDIPSYLRVFGKGHLAKHDTSDLERKFEEDEKGKTYKVMKEGHSLFTEENRIMTTALGGPQIVKIPFPRPKDSISDDECEYRPAVLDSIIPPKTFEYNNQSFVFDFQGNGVFVADDFEAIKDFLTLWSYLKREALVLEFDKTIEEGDIGVYFQIEPVTTGDDKKRSDLRIGEGLIMLSDPSSFTNAFQHDILAEAPKRLITSYIRKTWSINEEHLFMCNGFIGKKILPNSDLKIYSSNKYKTVNEIAQRHSLLVAWIALIVSFLATIATIFQLFQPSGTDSLKVINGNLVEISEKMTNLKTSNDKYFIDINESLDQISASLHSIGPKDYSEQFRELLTMIKEIQNILSEQLPMDKPNSIIN